MKKLFSSIFLIFCLLLLFYSSHMYYTLYRFNPTNVVQNIKYISSDQFKGRLPGTLENQEIATYINSELKKSGLKPYKGNEFQNFKVKYPKTIKGSPYLKVSGKDGILIKDFVYSKDFKEDMVNFRTNHLTFNKSNVTAITKDYIKVITADGPFILFVPPNNDLSFRSSFISGSKYNMYIMVTNQSLTRLKDLIGKDNTVDCFVPYEVSQTTVSNVMGYLEGTDTSSPPIIISAHFDHIGTDLNGTIYSGALDNASGLSFMLEMSKCLTSLGKPNRSILFIGFNAEEFGCLGSSQFITKYKAYIKNSKIFNFDMIGSNNPIPLCIMGAKNDTTKMPFIKSISKICESEKIFFNYLFEDSSDHESFRKQNIDAITFCDNDMTRIHTPKDTYDHISLPSIERCYNVASNAIVKCTFKDDLIILYYKECFLISIIGILIFSLLYNRSTKNT
ncbi:M28 family metallopeptidase [Clostridium estertheticum]|uniref:M28 family metallopeptidase n=1 Tax=Clostridium estertheticum TaxID=238834 RepID=UPI001C0D2CEF|nr:M28 family metallopeptidase [Clostridium estertheticum]MBU3185699.1 Zn-dependent exopeptidase M28 [Clostridium estertheticum]